MRSARVATPLVAAVAITFGLAGVAAGGNGHGHDPGKGHKAPGAPVTDPGGVIDLPPGYSYDVLARDCVDDVTSTESGATFKMPADFDANITVPGKGGTVQLLSAHELTKPVPGDFRPVPGGQHDHRQGAGGGLHRSDPCQADPGFPR